MAKCVPVTRVLRRATYRKLVFHHCPKRRATIRFIREHAMRKVLRGYTKGINGNLILIGTMPVPHSKDKPSPRERKGKRHLVRQGATIFKKETVS